MRTLGMRTPKGTSREKDGHSSDDDESVSNLSDDETDLVDIIKAKINLGGVNLSMSQEGLDGNIYRYWAFKNILHACGMSKLDGSTADSAFAQVGCGALMLLQIVGPVAVLIYGYYALDFTNTQFGLGDWKYIPGSYTYGISHVMKRCLGTLFLFLFILNGIYVIQRDQAISRKMWHMAKLFREADKAVVREVWLIIGPAANSWCVLLCCFAMFFFFQLSTSPKGIIFDGLSLLFLFSIDDVTGDLSFLSTQWDSQEMGDFYALTQKVAAEEYGTSMSLDDSDLHDVSFGQTISRYVMLITKGLLRCMVIIVPLLFVFTEGTRLRKTSDETMIEHLQSQIAMLMNASNSSSLPAGHVTEL